MSEEEINKILNKEIEQLINAGKCALASNSEAKEWLKTANAIKQVLQENTQLKKEYQTELDENCKLSELWKESQVENRQLKSVLKEIREEIEKEDVDRFGNPTIAFALNIRKDKILGIIDKGIEVCK